MPQTITLDTLSGDPQLRDQDGPALYVYADNGEGSSTLHAVWVGTDSSNGYHYGLEIDATATKNLLQFANISLPKSNLNSTLEIKGDKKAEPKTNSMEYTGWVGPHMDGLEFDYPQNGGTMNFEASAKDFPEGLSAANVFLGGKKIPLRSLGYEGSSFPVALRTS